MKNLIAVSIFVALAAAGARRAEATCAPEGYCPFTGCIGWFNWTSNPSFNSGSSCWTIAGNASVKTDGLMCNPGPYVQVGVAYPSATISQVVHVAGPGQPGYDPNLDPNHFQFDYRLQLSDPNHDGTFVFVNFALYNNATGALIKQIATFTGAGPTQACANTFLDFTSPNLVGKDVRIEVYARNIYSNTTIRVTRLSLWQVPL